MSSLLDWQPTAPSKGRGTAPRTPQAQATPGKPILRRTVTAAGVIAVWFAAVMAGMIALSHYKSTPGPQQTFPSLWPDGTELRREEGRHTLLVFLHPRCPCSRATVSELSRLIERAGAALRIQVVFHVPDGSDDAFAETELWRRVQELPGITAVLDHGGKESQRFGAATSGQTFLYAPDGALRFAGGITVARGHEGRSPGAERILAILSDAHASRGSAPVFGCELGSPEPAAQSGAAIRPPD